MKTTDRLLLSTLFWALACLTTASARPAGEIRVAAWNVQGVEFDSNGTPRPVFKAAQLVDAILTIQPDVIALSEVNSLVELKDIVRGLRDNDLVYRYTMLSQPVPQKVAILFRDGIEVDQRRFVPGSDAGQPNRLRKALSARVRAGNFDFLLVALHLKSGRSSQERATRTTQLGAIRNFISQRTQATGERDVLVVGDYNMVPDQDQVNFDALSPGPAGFMRFISTEELALPPGQPTRFQTSHISGCPQGKPRGNLLDGFAIARAGTESEYVADSLELLPLHELLGMSCTAYKATVSDHLPLVARFKTDLGDDD